MTKTYHRNVFMPAHIRALPETTVPIFPTRHALNAAATERFGAFSIPQSILFSGKDIVEATTENDKLSKLVVRIAHSEHYDAIYIFTVPERRLKTCYLNAVDDLHRTLDPAPYATS
jgi:hypothetical protein